MSELLKLAVYIFKTYPRVKELSKPRLVKLIYLIDWKHAIDYGRQVTNIKWYYNHYGPYVEEVINTLKERSDLFKIETRSNPYGGVTDRIELISNQNFELESEIKTSADFIISNTATKNWTDFINLVYSTYPIKNNSKYTFLNLVENAKQFNEKKFSKNS